MSEHIIEGALVAAREYLLRAANPESTYGYFHGGDPRDFSPDEESCTAEEIANHKAACEAWERGERPEYERHRHVAIQVGDTTAIASYAGAFGIGVYSIRDEDAEDVLEQVDAALASLSGRLDKP